MANKCCWVLSDGKHCGAKTRFKIVKDLESGRRVRKYSPWCPRHQYEVGLQDRKVFERRSLGTVKIGKYSGALTEIEYVSERISYELEVRLESVRIPGLGLSPVTQLFTGATTDEVIAKATKELAK